MFLHNELLALLLGRMSTLKIFRMFRLFTFYMKKLHSCRIVEHYKTKNLSIVHFQSITLRLNKTLLIDHKVMICLS